MQTDIAQTIQNTALDDIRELISAHWHEAENATVEEYRFTIGLSITVQDGPSPPSSR